jgi:thiol-disulfide isomerase/thioredoxin
MRAPSPPLGGMRGASALQQRFFCWNLARSLVLIVFACLVWHSHAQNLGVVDFSAATFQNDTASPALVKFYAPWCGHCRMMGPAYMALARRVHREFLGVKIAQVNDACSSRPSLRAQPQAARAGENKRHGALM